MENMKTCFEPSGRFEYLGKFKSLLTKTHVEKLSAAIFCVPCEIGVTQN